MARAILLPLLLAGASAGVPAGVSAAAIDDAARAFARPHQLVDIGGRRLNLYCSGSGPVTVVFEAQSDEAGWSWYAVQPKVAARTRACVYDRAGLGFSDPTSLPPTLGNAVDDLHALLGKAGIAPPYVLVGNSFGGAAVQLYTYRYPREVKALVLVESGHEDEEARMDAASQGKLKQMHAMAVQGVAHCAEAAHRGLVPGSADFAECTGGTAAGYPRALAAARLAMVMGPQYWDRLVAGERSGDAGDAELRAARRSFGDLPLVVLARGVSPYAIPGKPQSALNKAVEAENLAIQKSMAALSTRSSLHVVAGASHIIQDDKPQAVVDAVNEALDRAGY